MTRGLFTRLFGSRAAFLGCLMLLFVAVFGTAWLVGFHSYRTATDTIIAANTTRADLLAYVVEEHTIAALNAVKAAAVDEKLVGAVRDRKYLDALECVTRLASTHTELEVVFLADPDSKEWANSRMDERSYGRDLSHRDWYKGVSAGWKPYISNAYRRLEDQGLGVAVACPVRDESGDVIGILCALQSPQFFMRLVHEILPEATHQITLVDREGNMFFSERFPELTEITPYPVRAQLPVFKKGVRGHLEVRDASDDEEAKFISYAVMPEVQWAVIVESVKAEALQAERLHLTYIAASAALVFLALGGLLIHFRAKYLQLEVMRRVNETLETRVEERTNELQKTNAELKEEVAERKRAEERLRELTQRLTYHVDHSPLAVIEWGEDLRLTRWSGEAEQIFGWKAEEVIGKKKEDFTWIHPEDEPLVSQVSKSLRQGQLSHRVSLNRNFRKDGSVAFCEWYNSALFDDGGKVRSVLSLVLDVTDRRMAEEELRKAQLRLEAHAEELEKMVARRTVKLQETINELEHFSYAITHDMRAPLRAMQGFAQVLEEEFGNGADKHLCRDFLRRIRAASVRMDQLITDTLNYSKSVRQEFPTEAVDLEDLLHGLVETYPNLQPDKADIRVVGRIPRVVGNEAALTQCFSNLLGNAVKFAKHGEKPNVRVWAEATGGARSRETGTHNRSEIQISKSEANLNPEEANSKGKPTQTPPPSEGREPGSPGPNPRGSERRLVRVWVEDDGIGIPAMFQERIFRMFQRATKEYEGTGIGLAIVRKVVQRIGGDVGVESEEGHGSRFWVDLVEADDTR